MCDGLDRIESALAERYVIREELGRGGMAAVFLAEDLKNGRRVAIKVLSPRLAATVGPERFLREIDIAANLAHPHILPLHDSGDADGCLYYTMPYVEGESLRHRLNREGSVPVADALRIVGEVADALGSAHRHGIIHLDIKPENILFEEGHAVVADFGFARAINAAADTTKDAEFAVGTPEYMSPEQAVPDHPLDERSDVYSLSCVLYEMLAGSPPFSDPSAQGVLSRKRVDAPPGLRRAGVAVSRAVEGVLLRGLATKPSARFDDVGSFARALDRASESARAWSWRRRIALATAAAAAVALLFLSDDPVPGVPIDPDTIAVLPFSVTSVDPDLVSLASDIPELLWGKLTGEIGPRMSDRGLVYTLWRDAGGAADAPLPVGRQARIARAAGAGAMVVGVVVGTKARLEIVASLRDATTGRSRGGQTRVAGAYDELPSLLDHLLVLLLAKDFGEMPHRLPQLSVHRFDAVQHYLAGRRACRSGNHVGAVTHFLEALDADSSLALAALGFLEASIWTPVTGHLERARSLTWQLRDRFGPRDLAIVEAHAGPRYPEALPTAADLRAGWERAVGIAPDRAESWWHLGDFPFFHHGALQGIADWRERAAAAFRRAVELDSTFAAPLEHLIELASLRDDTAQVRRLTDTYLTYHPGAELADYVRWRRATILGDAPPPAARGAWLQTMTSASLWRVIGFAQLDAMALGDAVVAADVLRRRVVTDAEQAEALAVLHDLSMNRGRTGDAMDALNGSALGQRARWRRVVMDALYWELGEELGTGAARALSESIDRAAPIDPADRAEWYRDLCDLEQWRLWHGALSGARRAIAALRGARYPADAAWVVTFAGDCATLLAAILAVLEGHAEAPRFVDRLDSLLRRGSWVLPEGNLVLARLRERRGDLHGALEAVRRRPYHWREITYLSSFLREEARLAAAVGDTVGAARADRHYLRLTTGSVGGPAQEAADEVGAGSGANAGARSYRPPEGSLPPASSLMGLGRTVG